MQRICVYCGSSDGGRPRYRHAAQALGRALATRGLGVVYGGASVGTMGALADAALAAGGEVYGVIPTVLCDRELAHGGLTRLYTVATMHERKAMMNELADGFIALPGGFGTFEELFETVTWVQLGIHDKPIGVLNLDGYYDRLLAFLDHSVGEGFTRPALLQRLIVANGVDALLQRLAPAR